MNALNELSTSATYTGIEHRIAELSCELPDIPNISIQGKFFYLTFRNGSITEKEFAKFIYDKIIRYCIPRRKYREALELFQKTGEERFITDLHDQAKNLFVKSIKTHGAQLGEPGELIAFILLEAFFNAPQIACKMFLKTSEKMPVHGSDSVHVRFFPEGERLELIWGESKLYHELSTAFDKALESIAEFIGAKSTPGQSRIPRERDIDIIRDFPNVDNEKMKNALCDYFDPYTEFSNKWKEIYSCFIGFDYTLYNNLKGSSPEEIEEYFRKNYLNRIVSAYRLFGDKVTENKLQTLEFILLLLPFQSVENFRSEFYRLLGVSPQDLEVPCDD